MASLLGVKSSLWIKTPLNLAQTLPDGFLRLSRFASERNFCLGSRYRPVFISRLHVPNGKAVKNQWLLQAPPASTYQNSTFYQHSVFMCFIWISGQIVIISLYSVDWLVCITETECVYCAVRAGSLYIILRSAHTVYLCVLCGSQNKQRLFPYTALTDWFV